MNTKPIMTVSSLPKLAAMVLALSCFAGAAVAQEPVKIATIDLLKAFDSYWKTKLSNDQLKERGADFDKARVGMIEDLDLLREEYNRLNVSAQDPANSDEKRAADLKKTQEKISEFKRLEQQVIDFNKNAQKTLADQTRRLRKGRLEEIQEVISAKARELGYDLVIDLVGGVRKHLTRIPFHTMILSWPIEDRTDPEAVYKQLTPRISDLMELLRGEDED